MKLSCLKILLQVKVLMLLEHLLHFLLVLQILIQDYLLCFQRFLLDILTKMK